MIVLPCRSVSDETSIAVSDSDSDSDSDSGVESDAVAMEPL